jgi:hypothetical protein
MNIDDLFSEVNALATRDVAAAFNMSQDEARAWADELGVAKIGASFAWTPPDVEALADQLERFDDEDEDDEDDEDDDDDDDE